jgi:threonine dehydrogenase-like Zn-dependent dehydrogenase
MIGPVTVFGGTGFLGRCVVRHLREANIAVRVASRHPERGRRLFRNDDDALHSVAADIHDDRTIERAVVGAAAVVNAVSLYVEHGDETFHAVHVTAAERVARQARQAGVQHLAHVSGIGDVLGHKTMGEVVDVGKGNNKLKVCDRVVIPFNIACGDCYFCKKPLWSLCDRSNPNREQAAEVMGHSPSALFGYSHLMGGFAGGQAEYIRVPYADVGPIKVPEGIPDEQVLFLSDIFPTGYMAAENAGIEKGVTVAVWGCGPVAQFTIQSAWMLGAGRVIAIDRVLERLAMAQIHGRAETINFDNEDVYDRLQEMTKGRGPDCCIDAVGTEAHVSGAIGSVVDKVKTSLYPRHGPAERPSRDRHVLPRGRDGLGAQCLYWCCRQDSIRCLHEQGAHHEDGPNPHTPLSGALARKGAVRPD